MTSAIAAPVLIIGSWLIAPIGLDGYDSLKQTISELAAGDSKRRTPMTLVFSLTGLCLVVTAFSMPNFSTSGRLVLALGGISLIGVAKYPLLTMDSSRRSHTAWAAVHFTAMSCWPVFAIDNDSTWIQSWEGAIFSVAIMGAMFLWFILSLRNPKLLVGLSERFLAGANVLWPLFLAIQMATI
jgi:hypothetical protein